MIENRGRDEETKTRMGFEYCSDENCNDNDSSNCYVSENDNSGNRNSKSSNKCKMDNSNGIISSNNKSDNSSSGQISVTIIRANSVTFATAAKTSVIRKIGGRAPWPNG